MNDKKSIGGQGVKFSKKAIIHLRIDSARKDYYVEYCKSNDITLTDLIIDALDRKTKFKAID